MASPDKDSQFIVVERSGSDEEADDIRAEHPSLEAAEAEAKALAKNGKVHTVFQAISDFEQQEAPVDRTAYRQRPTKGKNEEKE